MKNAVHSLVLFGFLYVYKFDFVLVQLTTGSGPDHFLTWITAGRRVDIEVSSFHDLANS